MKIIKLLTLQLLFASASVQAGIMTETFDVHANNHVWNGGSGYAGNLGLNTGITFDSGDNFSVTVDNILDTWNFCSPSASCTINADGVRPASNTILGIYSNSGFAFAYGELVGRIGTGDFFSIGTAGFSGAANAAGELSLFHWDHNTNNSGSIKASVQYAVPEPTSIALLLSGVGFASFSRRLKK